MRMDPSRDGKGDDDYYYYRYFRTSGNNKQIWCRRDEMSEGCQEYTDAVTWILSMMIFDWLKSDK